MLSRRVSGWGEVYDAASGDRGYDNVNAKAKLGQPIISGDGHDEVLFYDAGEFDVFNVDPLGRLSKGIREFTDKAECFNGQTAVVNVDLDDQ